MGLVEEILKKTPNDLLTEAELSVIIGKSDASRHNMLKRAIAKGTLLHVRRGLYYLGEPYRRASVNPYELAQKIYGPSYISFESALAYWGLIPEAVYSVTSASTKRAREFKTPLGEFSYTQVPVRVFIYGVERLIQGPHAILMATPLKALTDYVYVNRLSWHGIKPLSESLRIDPAELDCNGEDIAEIEQAYQSLRVSRFLVGLRKDLEL